MLFPEFQTLMSNAPFLLLSFLFARSTNWTLIKALLLSRTPGGKRYLTFTCEKH
jgi:hypothetical protein